MTFRTNRGGGRPQFRVSVCAARGWVAAMIREMQKLRFDTGSRSARFSQKRDKVEAAAEQQ